MAARKEQNWAAQGRRFEHEVIHDLAGSPDGTHAGYGYDCIRSAASKGVVDIVAVAGFRWLGRAHSLGCRLLFIQCKRTDPVIPPAERLALNGLAVRAGALPVVAHRVDGAVHYRVLTGSGPKEWKLWHPATEYDEVITEKEQ